MILPTLTPDRLVLLVALLGFALLQMVHRNITKYKAPPLKAVFFAFAELLAQAAVLVLVLLVLNNLALSLFPPGSLLGWVVLIVTVVIAYTPVKQISSFMKAQLTEG